VAALELELKEDLLEILARQENSLRRELDRIDQYFENYAQELAARATHSTNESVRLKKADRLAAAKAEHERRRADQIARHEIRVLPHLDALLLIAEPAWRGELEIERTHQREAKTALFIPRSRRWEMPT
jgi:sugar-specific transcriptional regulator TrmB